ncbi:MAG: sulfatase [Proteobacteria bacterium]|nr:sulfatase [Pseudomonadota bacterium]
MATLSGERSLMKGVFAFLLLCACGSGPEPNPVANTPNDQPPALDSPNVLLVVWDTVRADRLGPYGYDRETSPYLSRLAQKSVVYQRAVSPAVWTLPAHSSLFTGKMVTEHGVNGDYQRLDDEHQTISEVLAEVGYDTYAFSANPFVTKETGLLQGFAQVHHPWDDEWADKTKEVIRKHIIDGDINGKKALSKRKGGKHWAYQESAPVANEAFLGWLDERGEDKPFFAFINLMEAHATRLPSPRARKKLIDPSIDKRAMKVDQSAPTQLAWMAGAHEYSKSDLKALEAVYDATIFDLDRALLELIDGLKERNLNDNTLLILTSDHGEGLGEHNRMGHQFHVYNTVSRVPLIMHWSKGLAPKTVTAPISTADLFGLIIEAGNLPVPTTVKDSLKEAQQRRGTSVVTEYTAVLPGSIERLRKKNPKADLAEFDKTYHSVEWDDYKLIQDSSGASSLFDVKTDPEESKNLAKERADILQTGQELLTKWKGQHTAWEPKGESTAFDEDMQAGLQALGYISDEDEDKDEDDDPGDEE